MASLPSSASAQPNAVGRRSRAGWMSEILAFWRQFFVQAFSPYRPELHYMRGPGPAWRAKHGNIGPPRQT
ncbi:hypothetical protein ACTZWT_00485 [Rhodopseudomonas sp. NSM]|uniref:hypothetical protein n=1 Tax=Rhodopseudomonas sp. NSM TaxID=3457630 RepID=UPI004035650B